MKYLDYPKSGSIAGTTYSRNRFGQYTRNRRTPVNPGTSFQRAARTRLASNSVNFRGLTGTQRDGWAALGLQMLRTDALGSTYTLTGAQAYCSVNNNLAAAGDTALSDAPLLVIPDGILTVTPTISNVAFSVAWTPTPLGTGERIFIFAGPQRSAGRAFEGDYRLILVSAAAGTSPSNVLSVYQARFGTPVTGARIFVAVHRYKGGFLSPALSTSTVVT